MTFLEGHDRDARLFGGATDAPCPIGAPLVRAIFAEGWETSALNEL